MKLFLSVCFSILLFSASSQKYALIDKSFASPISYSNDLSASEKMKGMFPVEKANLRFFIQALEVISAKLHSNDKLVKAENYQLGCTTFTGFIVTLARGERMDYILKSSCDNFSTTMHLVDSKLSKENNAYFVDTWLKYIKRNIKNPR